MQHKRINKIYDVYKIEIRSIRRIFIGKIVIMSIIYIITMVLSFIFFINKSNAAYSTFNKLIPLYNKLNTSSNMLLMIRILVQNMIACFIIITSGLIPFILIPILPMIVNCFTHTAVIYLVGSRISFISAIAAYLPHGIIEIPIMIFATCIGIKLSQSGLNKRRLLEINESHVDASDNYGYIQALKTYAIIIVPLLTLASFMETFVTPIIISLTK